jgi:TonB-linked SusC/RagA family outer membrane protein
MFRRKILFFIFVILTYFPISAQKVFIDLTLKDATLEEFVSALEKQTGYTFMYDNTLNENLRFTLIEIKSPIDVVLKNAFEGKEVEFLVVGNQIVLKRKTETPPELAVLPKRIKGTVVDEKGDPIIGVTVYLKGSTIGTITGLNGEFSLESNINGTLIFSHISYLTRELDASKVSNTRIILTEESRKIEEVVVLGYGTSLKKDLTGAVSSFSSEIIKNQTLVKDFIQALQGQIAGADITSENAPGDGSTIHIRGYNSLNASNAPLVVVDDAPYSGNFNDLNPNEIEKIDILKDASSTAIYGSRGANGVVIITTKRGNDRGKLTVEYNGFYGVGKSAGNFDMMNGETFMRYKTLSGSPFDAIQNRVIAKQNYIDWQKVMFGGTSQKTDHTLSINMSSARSRSAVQLGYNKEQGIIENMTFERISGRFTGDLDLTRTVKMGYSASLTHSLRENGDGNVWRNGTLLDPLTEVYDENGAMRFYNSGWNINALHSNPIFDTKRENVDSETKRDRMLGNAYISWLFAQNMTFRSSLTYDYTSLEEGGYYSATSQYRSGASSGAYFRRPTENSITFTNNLNFAKRFGAHDLKMTLVHDMQKYDYNVVGATGFDLPYSGLWYNVNESQLNLTTQANRWEWAILSFMGRINYSFNNKYLFTFTGRGDGSSKLAKGHKWGFFPSAAFAWRLNEESFFKSVENLSNLKLRIGWGISGNTAINAFATYGKLGRFPYNFGITSDNSAIGYVPSEVQNPNLGWERTSEVNIGLDFGFFKNRINGSIDVYQKNTYDLLMKRNLPTTSGYSEVWQNVGQTRNTGIELTLQAIIVSKKDFSWTTNLTFNYNKNEIVQLFNGTQDSPSNKWFIGQPIDVEWITKYNGVWQTNEAAEAALYSRIPGQSKLLDANNDKIIDQDDNFVFNRIPKFVGGFSSTFKYKDFDFSFYLYSRLDYGRMLGIITIPDLGTANWNQLNYNFWTPTNPTNDGPQPALTRDAYAQGSSFAYRDLSFVRLKNINFGYVLPNRLAQKIKSNSFRFFVVVDNPYIWSRNDFVGVDPENCNSPLDARPLRSIAIGINAKF